MKKMEIFYVDGKSIFMMEFCLSGLSVFCLVYRYTFSINGGNFQFSNEYKPKVEGNQEMGKKHDERYKILLG